MAETFILDSTLSDQEVEKNINQSTRFVIVPDNFNINHTGWPNTWEWCKGKITFIEKLVEDFPNCMFIFDRKNWFEADNTIWMPMFWFECIMNDLYKKIDVNWTGKRRYTSHFISGRYRIARVLANFWLAKNYPLNQIVFTNPESNNDLKPIKDILLSSEHLNLNHINPNIHLNKNWVKIPEYKGLIDGVFVNQLYQQFHSQSYVSILQADNGIELNTTMSEKIFRSLLSGIFSLHIGNHKIDKVLQDLGFEVFNDIFDFEALHSSDRYWMTVGVLEQNKKLISDHQKIESLWFEKQDALKHNRKLSMDRKYWLEKFKKEIKILKDSLSLPCILPHWYPGQLSWISQI